MKYPLDNKAIETIAQDLIQHNLGQNRVINKLVGFVQEALKADEEDWHDDARAFLKDLEKRKMDFESHRFNQSNGYNVGEVSPYPSDPNDYSPKIDLMAENKLNTMEKDFGEEMSPEELAAMFNVPAKKEKKKKADKLSKMTIEEIEALEAEQDNSNDIYKVAARMKNAARLAVKGNLTAQGDMVVNTFTHLVKGLYDFAATVHDKETRVKLMQFARKQEEAPANLISALWAGVKTGQ